MVIVTCGTEMIRRELVMYLFLVLATLTQADNLSTKTDIIEGIMLESLRSNLLQGCENDKINLHCPRNTHIIVENTFYGRLVPSNELCPVGASSSLLQREEDTSCDVPEAQARVIELCRSKRKCRIGVKSSFFDRDPCPHTSKYLQTSYKCRPTTFEDQNFCESTRMELSCKPGKRLFIYSAHYGATQASQASHCSLRQPVQKDCVADVLPHVLHRCHAQTSCVLPVDDSHLGNPCPVGVSKFLSLIFMCVNEEVFSEAAIKGELESIKTLKEELNQQSYSFKENTFEVDETDDIEFSTTRSPPFQLTPKRPEAVMISEYRPEVQRGIEVGISMYTEKTPTNRAVESSDMRNELMILGQFLKENKEKTALYLFLFVSCSIILVLLVCICQQCRPAKTKRPPKTPKRSQQNLLKSTQSVVEQSSLLGSNHTTSPMYMESDSPNGFDDYSSTFGRKSSSQHYVRFSQVSPPRIPCSLHYYS